MHYFGYSFYFEKKKDTLIMDDFKSALLDFVKFQNAQQLRLHERMETQELRLRERIEKQQLQIQERIEKQQLQLQERMGKLLIQNQKENQEKSEQK